MEAGGTISLRRRDPSSEQGVTNLELFFDLVYVFAVTQLSHLLLEHLTWEGAAQTGFLLLVVWWAWCYTTWVANWFDPDWVEIRALLIFCMLASFGMAIAIPDAFGDRGLLFAGAYVAMQVVRSGVATRFFAAGSPERRTFTRITIWMVVSGVFWIAGGLLDGEARTVAWIVALAIDYAGPLMQFRTPGLGRSSFEDWSIDGGLLAERFQLFVIIALGESIVVTGATASELELDAETAAAVIVAFLGSAALWWLYFDEVATRTRNAIARRRDERGRLARDAFTYMHLPIIAGIIVSAVGDELLIAHPGDELGNAGMLCVVGGAVLYLLGQQGFRYAMIRRLSRKRTIAIAALVVWGLVAQSFSALAVASGVLAILVGLVISETRQRLVTSEPG